MQNSWLIKYKVHHLLWWLLVFAIWYFLRYDDYRTPALAWRVTAIKVIDLAIMIYITNYVFLPRLFYRKKYAWFVVALVLLVVISSFTKMHILGKLMNAPQLYFFSGAMKQRFYDNVLPHFFLVIAGAAIKLMIDYSRLQQRLAEIAKEKAEAELNFLKSQINPHFLFNSLNSVYFLINKDNREARESLHKFSDMLRYQLYELNGASVPIEKEIAYLEDYVGLQKLRKNETYQVTMQHSPEVKGFQIEPLLLVPFVENAFKHVSSDPGGSNFIHIGMHCNNGHFIFTTENTQDRMKPTDPHSGIGLSNVKRRLELLYPGKHSLQIDTAGQVYKVELKIEV